MEETLDMKEQIKEKLKALGPTLSPKELKRYEESLTQIFIDGKPIWEAIGLTKEGLELIYSNAYNLYNSGKYKEARQMFFLLNYLNPEDVRYDYALAACFQLLGSYEEAVALYLKCLYRDPQNPSTYWYIAECYQKLNRPMQAMIMLQACIKHTGVDPKFEKLKYRAENEFTHLEREVLKSLKEEKKEA